MAEPIVTPVVAPNAPAPEGGEEHVDVLPPKRRSESTYPDTTREQPQDDAETIGDEEPGEPEKKAAPKPPVKQKYKIGDKEWDEDDLKERLDVAEKRKEHLRAANKRFEESAALVEKEVKPVKALMEQMKKNPLALFDLAKKLGLNPDEVVAQYAQKFIEQEKLTPEQRKTHEAQTALEQREQEIAAREEKLEQDRLNQEAEGYRREFSKQVAAVLPKYGLPDDPLTVGEIGRIVAGQIRAGMDPDYEVAAEIESERLDGFVAVHLDRLSRTPGALAKKYPEIAKRLREEDVANATAPRSAPRKPVPNGKPATPAPAKKSEIKTWEEEEAEERARRYNIKPQGG